VNEFDKYRKGEKLKVNQLANDLHTSAHTVRFYTRIGFLEPAKDKVNGYKEYGQKEKARLRFILSARQLGFTVIDIGKIIQEADKGNTPCPLTREIVRRRLKETEFQFEEVTALRKRMETAVAQWREQPNKAPTGNMICHLIENFQSQPQR
tara:strand:- start:318 stop:770 length:453 start_codon:yes stop_codon:yes gene_type:complete